MSETVQILLPIGSAIAGGVLGVLADAFGSRRLSVALSAAGTALGAVVAVWLVYELPGTLLAYNVLAGGGGFAAIGAVVLTLSALSLVGGWAWFTRSPAGGSAAALIALAGGAAAALAGTVDMVFLLIALECLALTAYALVAQSRNARSDEAAMKYVVQGAVATGLLVLGIAILVGVYGGTSGLIPLQASAAAGGPLTPLAGAMALVVAAFAYKLGGFPFHSWAPDVFETAPPASAGYLAGAPKVGAVLAAFIVSSILFGSTMLPAWQFSREIAGVTIEIDQSRISVMWAVLAAGSIIFGNLAALRQESYGRMLGYSGIAQVGYAMIGLAVGERVVGSTMLLMTAYAFAALAAFLGGEAVRCQRPGWDGSIGGMAGFGRSNALVGAAVAVAMFSLTGIPLTAGFWGKLLVFGAAVGFGWEWLVVIGVLGSVVSFGYYGKVLRSMYFEPAEEVAEPSGDDEGSVPATGSVFALPATLTASLVAAAVVAVGIAPLVWGLGFLQRFFAFG